MAGRGGAWREGGEVGCEGRRTLHMAVSGLGQVERSRKSNLCQPTSCEFASFKVRHKRGRGCNGWVGVAAGRRTGGSQAVLSRMGKDTMYPG